MIAYGLHIGTRVEMSTLGETNNAQFFSERESCAFYRDSNSGICEPPIILSSISSGLPICSAHLQEPKTLAKKLSPPLLQAEQQWQRQFHVMIR